MTYGWHHVELHGHSDDVEPDDGRDGQVKVLGSHHAVDDHTSLRVIVVVGSLQHFYNEIEKLTFKLLKK